jgi:hypothetical protein
MVRLLSAVLLVTAGAAWAQAKPSVMLFPLEFKRVPSAMPKADRDGLVSDAERLLRVAGAQLPDLAKGEAALADLKRQDCEREDACLQQLAQKAETLYALYANIDFTLEGQVVVTGRVVRDDGKLVSPLQTVRLPKGANEKHRDIGKNALTGLYELLKVKELPAVREVAQPVVVVTPPVEVKKDPPPPPPPAEVKVTPSGPSPVAKGLVYAGAGVAVAGLATLVAGAGIGGSAGKTTLENGDVYAADPQAAANLATGRTLTAVGFVGLGLGAAAAAVGAVLWATTPGAPQVTFMPTAQGGALVVGGSF